MPRKKAVKFKCKKCGQEFGMAMHLGRHMVAIHGQAPKTAKPAKAKKAAKAGARKARGGRPPAAIARLGLKNMSLTQLVDVIAAAKQEGERRIAEIQQVLLPITRKRVGRPRGRKIAASPKAPAKAKRRARRKFKMSGTESILAFVKKAGKKGATTAEIIKNWKSQGRSGDGYTTLGELVKTKKLKREPLKEQKGSRYTAA